MTPSRTRSGRTTRFIQLDTRACEACWKCVEQCHKQVLGKVEVLWHTHARIVAAEACTGCLKCVGLCEHGALTKT